MPSGQTMSTSSAIAGASPLDRTSKLTPLGFVTERGNHALPVRRKGLRALVASLETGEVR